eukprot:1052386-Alexandrium_andersonii.AAC.1
MWVRQRVGEDGATVYTSSWINPAELPPEGAQLQQWTEPALLREDPPQLATSSSAVAPTAPSAVAP